MWAEGWKSWKRDKSDAGEKSAVTDRKNALGGLISDWTQLGKEPWAWGSLKKKTPSKMEKQRELWLKITEQSIRGLWDNYRRYNIRIMGLREERGKKQNVSNNNEWGFSPINTQHQTQDYTSRKLREHSAGWMPRPNNQEQRQSYTQAHHSHPQTPSVQRNQGRTDIHPHLRGQVSKKRVKRNIGSAEREKPCP